MNRPSVTVITPWRDAHELAPAYWRAIEAGIMDGDRVIVVDNGSDPSVRDAYFARTEAALPAYATILRSQMNLGFSRACNAAFERAGTEAVLFLNNDVVMTDPGWLAAIRAALRPGVLVGARLRSDPHTAVDGQTVPYLDGWCIAAYGRTWLKVGGWSEQLEEPAYYGDNELAVRAARVGVRLVEVLVGLRHLENYTSRRMRFTEVAARNRERYAAAVREARSAAR